MRSALLQAPLPSCADELAALEAREKELGIRPDPAIAAAMAALAADSSSQQLYVDVLLRTLGLEECADTQVGGCLAGLAEVCWRARGRGRQPCG